MERNFTQQMKSLKAIIYIQETFKPDKNISFNIRNPIHKKFLKLIKKGYDQTLEESIDIQIFEYYFDEIRRIENDIYKQYRKKLNLRTCTYNKAIEKIKDARTLSKSMRKMPRTTM